MQVVRMNQRTQDDCAICTTAMVLGYAYERVVEDRWQRYAQFDDKTAWWECYFNDEGRLVTYLPLEKRAVVEVSGSLTLGVLRLEHPRLQVAHVVVLDELGVVDPADSLPEHMPFVGWATARMSQGFVLDNDFLVVGLPRVTVQIIEKRDEARALEQQLGDFPHGIASMRIVAASAEGREAVGYVVRSLSSEIVGWGHARLLGGWAELSYETHPSHRGHGYMGEATPQFVAALLLLRPDVIGTYAYIEETNIASEKVAQACGMILADEVVGRTRLWSKAANPPSA